MKECVCYATLWVCVCVHVVWCMFLLECVCVCVPVHLPISVLCMCVYIMEYVLFSVCVMVYVLVNVRVFMWVMEYLFVSVFAHVCYGMYTCVLCVCLYVGGAEVGTEWLSFIGFYILLFEMSLSLNSSIWLTRLLTSSKVLLDSTLLSYGQVPLAQLFTWFWRSGLSSLCCEEGTLLIDPSLYILFEIGFYV